MQMALIYVFAAPPPREGRGRGVSATEKRQLDVVTTRNLFVYQRGTVSLKYGCLGTMHERLQW